MITGAIKSHIDQIWNVFWSGVPTDAGAVWP
jgi:hypothetical protein